MGYFDSMKFPVSRFLAVLFAAPSLGRTVVWSVDGAHEHGWTLLSVGGHVVRQGRGSALDVTGLPAGPYLMNLRDGRAAHVMVR